MLGRPHGAAQRVRRFAFGADQPHRLVARKAIRMRVPGRRRQRRDFGRQPVRVKQDGEPHQRLGKAYHFGLRQAGRVRNNRSAADRACWFAFLVEPGIVATRQPGWPRIPTDSTASTVVRGRSGLADRRR